MSTVVEVIDLLKELAEDSSVTKNLKTKVSEIIAMLSGEEELSLRVNRASHALDELASNPDLDSYTRTQLLGIVGALETVKE
jgi:uncharacterized protein (UPF0147 family)